MPKPEERYTWLHEPIENERRRGRAIAGFLTLAAAFSAGAAIAQYHRHKPPVVDEGPVWRPTFDPAQAEYYEESREVFNIRLRQPVHKGILAILGNFMVEKQPLSGKDLNRFAVAVVPGLTDKLMEVVRGYGTDYDLFAYNNSGDFRGFWTAKPAGVYLAQPEHLDQLPELKQVVERLEAGQPPFNES